MSNLIVPLIMCGGAGTRLWPASREGRPKQFLRLFGRYSTFQETLHRVSDPSLFAAPIIITNTQYRFLVAEQLAEIGVAADILLEPIRRDSAPAIVAGTSYAKRRGGDPIVLALAADHIVTDTESFLASCRCARDVAERGYIVTFGVKPDRPAVEYGYVGPGAALGEGACTVKNFFEKPDQQTAARYIAEGYFWNSGNFMFGADTMLDDYRAFEPASAAAVAAAVANAGSDLGFVTLAPEFGQARAVSIDFAVMEKTKRAAVIPASLGWSDVGSWQAVWELTPRDSSGNAAKGEALFLATSNSYVASEKALVALLGVEDLVVIATEDALLVTRRDNLAEMKQLVEQIKLTAPRLVEDHLKVHRPWGSYQSLDQGDRYQVKRIVVKPGGRLSLQLHHHRAEHWVVVRGTAGVVVGQETRIIHENESVYIPIGSQHRLENPGKIDLELIEVQTGSYLGEDDIVRIEDDYRRK
ncbi:MAG TPA: mannose-1-phosphate guanylyltransferase/mannose-6-phosphate isomerase [Xanthobacteraceae bacterium]|jgi:mannose-1-phosphate guanylyltransferase/mannose-6-phosphate isomerase